MQLLKGLRFGARVKRIVAGEVIRGGRYEAISGNVSRVQVDSRMHGMHGKELGYVNDRLNAFFLYRFSCYIGRKVLSLLCVSVEDG